MHQIIAVDKGSFAARYGIVPGDFVLSINGEPLIDDIDYQALTAARRLKIQLIGENGEKRLVEILKPGQAPLGLRFAQTLVCDPRSCSNHCVFCFVDQMPTGMRKSLYVKDDDWRLSLMMGNFVTLTNVGERELDRIIRRKASPLYISVHATDPEVRVAMMNQPRAAELMPRLRRLCDAGISFHCQIVLCPGLNDGAVLQRSLEELYAMRPYALSVALVPVGLTKYREALTELQPYGAKTAEQVLQICEAFQQKALQESGTRFVFAADEFICLADALLPPDEAYEGYPQLENGIGMIRSFQCDLEDALKTAEPLVRTKTYHLLIACGTSIAPYMREWASKCVGPGVSAEVVPVLNRFFGETVTVSGLVVGQDLAQQLFGRSADLVLLPDNMLNANKAMFLDDMSVDQLQQILGIPVRPIPCDGHDFCSALQDPSVLFTQGKEEE